VTAEGAAHYPQREQRERRQSAAVRWDDEMVPRTGSASFVDERLQRTQKKAGNKHCWRNSEPT